MTTHRSPFVELQHRALAALQDGFRATDVKQPEAAFARARGKQSNLVRTRSDARRQLQGGELLRFERWLLKQIELRNRVRDFSPHRDVLYETPREVRTLSSFDAFQQVLQILEKNLVSINAQLNSVMEVNQFISTNHLLEAEATLQRHRKRFGATYWSAETEIALVSGRATNDEVRGVQKLLSANQRGLVRFFLYAAAARSDSSQPATRQLAMLARRIRNADLTAPQKIHTLYRATTQLPSNEEDLAVVLSYELLLSPLDAVLSALTLAYAVSARNIAVESRTRAIIETLLSKYCTSFASVPFSWPQEKSAHARLCVDLTAFIQAAVSGLLSDPAYQPTRSAVGLEGAIAAQLTADDASTREWLYQFTASFPSHAWSIQLRPALPLQTLVELVRDIAEERFRAREAPVHREIAQAFIACATSHQEPSLRALIASTVDAVHERRDETHRDPVGRLSKTAGDCVAVASAWSLLQEGRPADAMTMSLSAGLRNQRVVESTPLVQLFEGKSWRHLKHFDALLELCCALQLYHAATGDPQAKTTKRFAVAALMERADCTELTTLILKLGALPRVDVKLLHFFVSHVLDLPLIELLGVVDSTEAAQLELVKVLRAGAKLPGADSTEIEARVAEVEHFIAVSKARGAIDATKVFVGESELIHKATLEYQLTYENYRRLVAEHPLGDVDIDELLRVRPTDLESDVAESQRHLHEIMTGVLELFLNDPSAGLDSVIGRRIRHGTITGALRGTLDQVGMISHRPKAGAPYEVSKRMATDLAGYPARLQAAVAAAMGRFSSAIDNLCQVLCDEVFQCQKHNPTARLRPAFALEVNARNLSGPLQLALQNQPFEEFLRICFAMFWMGIYANIERERPAISTYVKKALRDACANLQTELKGLDLPDRLLVDRAQLASDQLLTKGDVVLSWLAVPKADDTSAFLLVSHIASGTELLVRGQHTDFAPNVTIDATAEALSLDNGMLLHDALYILFDNTASHGGLPCPDVDLQIDFTANGFAAKFSCTISPAVFMELERGKLFSLQNAITAKGTANVAKLNKGSGLAKLSNLTIARGGRLSMELKSEPMSLITEFVLPLHISKHASPENGLEVK